MLRLEINLKKFAAIAVGTTLWEHEKIRSKLKEFFADCESYMDRSPKQPEWQEIEQEVSKHVSLLFLPEELLSIQQDLVKPIGEKIFSWNMYVLNSLALLPKYAYKIYWTPFGTIDESKIFDNYWVPISEKAVQVFVKKRLREAFDMFVTACLFIRKNFIRQHSAVMLLGIQDFMPSIKISNNKFSVHAIIVLWLCVNFTENKEKALALYLELKADRANADNYMLKLCVYHDFFDAAKYFLNRLKKEKKEMAIIELAEECSLKFANEEKMWRYRDKLLETLCFLMNHMTPDVRKGFISGYILPIFVWYTQTWPFQEIVEPIINEYFLDLNSANDVTDLLHFASACVLDETASVFMRNMGRQMVSKMYKKATKDGKRFVFCEMDNFYLSRLMVDNFDIPFLSLILNDPDLSDFKKTILQGVSLKCKSLIRSKNFAMVNKFIKRAFHTEAEQKEFKWNINILPELIADKEDELANEVIDWLSDSDADRKILEVQIATIKNLSFLVQRMKV